MQENPYKPLDIPEEDDVIVADVDESVDLRLIASRQRQVLFALLATILLSVAAAVINAMIMSTPPSEDNLTGIRVAFAVTGLLSVAFTIWRLVATFLLAKILYSTGSAILWTIGNIIPLLGIILLVVLNQKAIAKLQQHGIKVGFMGVNPNDIPSAVGGERS